MNRSVLRLLTVTIIFLHNINIKPYNKKDLLKLASGEINLTKCDFSHANLSEQDLSHKNLSKANFEYAILTKANLQGSNLKKTNLKNVKAIKTNFLGCNMQKSICSYASFVGAAFGNKKIHNWNCADLRNADLRGTIFIKANLDKVDFRNVIVNSETDFSYSSMFLVQINRNIFDIVKYENTFIIEKPDDTVLQTLITEFSELKLESLRFKNPKDPEKIFINTECPVCLEEFGQNIEVAMLPCGHIAHEECLKLCLERKSECPICRFKTNHFKRINIKNIID
jgi:hypothetical protein